MNIRKQSDAMAGLKTVFIALSIAWVLFLPVAAFAASRPIDGPGWGHAFAYVIYRIGGLICHQRAERSFELFGEPLAVCARCTGIYAGAALMAAVELFRDMTRDVRPINRGVRLQANHSKVRLHPNDTFRTSVVSSLMYRARTIGAARVVLFAGAVPSLATLAYEWTTGVMPAHWIRATTGALLGAAIAFIVCGAASPSGRGNVIN
jgi:hypothetical protein